MLTDSSVFTCEEEINAAYEIISYNTNKISKQLYY